MEVGRRAAWMACGLLFLYTHWACIWQSESPVLSFFAMIVQIIVPQVAIRLAFALENQNPPHMPPIRLRRRIALVQRDASFTRESQSSVASNYQTSFRSQGIKRPARVSPAFDEFYFFRMYPSYLR